MEESRGPVDEVTFEVGDAGIESQVRPDGEKSRCEVGAHWR